MNTNLIKKLRVAHARSSGNRWMRLAARPIKIGGPHVLARFGVERSVMAHTFFGRHHNVILPEVVSVNIWRYGFFEEDVAFYLLACLKPGGTFIDIGAHFGFFSMFGAELVSEHGTVISFEPMPNTRAILSGNMSERAAPCTHYLIPAAAGAKGGTLVFKDFGLVGSAFATSEDERSTQFNLMGEVEVQMRTIDQVVAELGLARLDLIKIDAENAEAEVVAGADETIAALKPSLVLETGDSDGSKARPIIDSLTVRGYRAFEFEHFTLKPHVVQDHYGYMNLLMVHKARLADVDGTQA